MASLQILSLLLLTSFIMIPYGQRNKIRYSTTFPPPTTCVCNSWYGNSSYIIKSDKGYRCKESHDGYHICEDCFKNRCKCVSEKDDTWCTAHNNSTEAISAETIGTEVVETWVIISSGVGIVYCCCFIGCVLYYHSCALNRNMAMLSITHMHNQRTSN